MLLKVLLVIYKNLYKLEKTDFLGKNPNNKMNQFENYSGLQNFCSFIRENGEKRPREFIKTLVIKTAEKLGLENIFINSTEDYLKGAQKFCTLDEELSMNIKPIPDMENFMFQMFGYIREIREKIETKNKNRAEDFWKQIEPHLYEGTWFVDHLGTVKRGENYNRKCTRQKWP